MEIKTLEIDDKHTVRMFVDNGENWFCVADLCECLGTKSKPARILEKVDDENKRTETMDNREFLFVLEDSASDIIKNSRGKNSKEMKALLSKFVKGKKKVKLLKKKETKEDEVEIDNTSIDEAFTPILAPRIKIPESKKEQSIIVQNTPSQSTINPMVLSAFKNNPELAKYIIDKEYEKEKERLAYEKELEKHKAELELKKAELDARTKELQIQAQAKRDSVNNKLEFIKHCEFFVKEGLRNAYPTTRPEDRIFVAEHAKACLKILQDNYETDFKMSSDLGSGTRTCDRGFL